MKRVLVALDGTDASQKALEVACALADTYDSALGLLSVVEHLDASDATIRGAMIEGVLSPAETGSYTDLLIYRGSPQYAEQVHALYSSELARSLASSIVEEAGAFARSSSAKAVKTFVRDGDPTRAILEVAKENAADVIVLGHEQRHGIKALIHRSVAEKVVKKAACPCLVYAGPPAD